MNKKQCIALAMLTTTVGMVAEASADADTRWHIGIDVGLAQYKQERKLHTHPKYKDVNEILDKEIATIDQMKAVMMNLRTLAMDYHIATMQNQFNQAQNQINGLNTPNAVQQTLQQILLNNNGFAPNPAAAQQIINAIPNINHGANNAQLSRQAAINYLQQHTADIWGVKGTDFHFANVMNYAGNNGALANRQADLRAWQNTIASLMKKNNDKVGDLVRKEALKKYDKEFMQDMHNFINTDLDGFLGRTDMQWALNNQAMHNWATNTNWYGQNNHPNSRQAIIAQIDAIRNAHDGYEELLKDIKIKRQETEKVSSGRINSPIVEANFGVTTQCGHGVFGAEMLVGVNCKDFKKKKSDIYKQKRTPIYVAGIVRAGVAVGNAELYALGGARFNSFVPIVGAGARFYSANKSYFFKAEFQKTLGKKYPKGHTIKLGFGWTM